jgi:hypothetical protein
MDGTFDSRENCSNHGVLTKITTINTCVLSDGKL